MPIADESRAASVTAIRKGRSKKSKSSTEQPAVKKKTRAESKPPKDTLSKSSGVKHKPPAPASKKTPTKKTPPKKTPPKKTPPAVTPGKTKRKKTPSTDIPPKQPQAKTKRPTAPKELDSKRKSTVQKKTATPPPVKKTSKAPPAKDKSTIVAKAEPAAEAKQPTTPIVEKPTEQKPAEQKPTEQKQPVEKPPIESKTAEASTIELPTIVESEKLLPSAAIDIATAEPETKSEQPATAPVVSPAENSSDSSQHSIADLRWSNTDSSAPAAEIEASRSDMESSLGDIAVSAGTSTSNDSNTPESDPSVSASIDSDVPWFVQTFMGEQFGPLLKLELDDWVTQGRLTGDCHIFQEGWEEWKQARSIYPELELVDADDEEVELAIADTDKFGRSVSSSEPSWYTVRTGLSMISNSTIAAIVTFVVLTVGFLVDRTPISQLYFGIKSGQEVDLLQGGGLVSMVLVSWGIIGMFMALIGILVGTIACMAIPRKTNLYPYVVGAVSASSLTAFMAVLLFTAAFLSLTPVAEILPAAGPVTRTLLSATPWAFFICWQITMSTIVVFVGMLAQFLDLPKIGRQMRWFGALQGGLLFWVLIDAAIIPDDSAGMFMIALFIFLAAVIASLVWLFYLTRSVRDGIRPS